MMSLDSLLESKHFFKSISKICTDILKLQRKPTRASVAFYLIVSTSKEKKRDCLATCWRYTQHITISKKKCWNKAVKKCSKIHNAGINYQSHLLANVLEKQP